ncbi:helix-turn-helix domain-containing protein [Paenibacillus terreus]|uniref:Helix-turn-helix domain-containing protein n=1 Tax=Paenibacillus terreus TaxID=1387834 RepID=A0ABV5B6C6_9BACL
MIHHFGSEWAESYFQSYSIEAVQSLYTTSNMPTLAINEHHPILVAVSSGQGILEAGGSSYEFDAGSVFLIPANHQAVLSAEPLRQIHAYIAVIGIREPAAGLPGGTVIRESRLVSGAAVHFFAEASLIALQLEELYIHRLPNSESRHIQNQILFHQILLGLLERMEARNGGNEQPSLERSIVYLEDHFHEKLTSEKLSVIAGVSRSHYSILFKQLTGFSPNKYLSRLRVHRSKEMMMEGVFSLREIALKVGYKDEFYLSRRFKQETGETPSAYNRRPVQRVAVWLAPYASHLLLLGLEPAAMVSDSSEYIRSEEVPLPQNTRFIDADRSLEQVKSAFLDADIELIIAAGQHLHQMGLSSERLRSVAPVIEIPWMELGWKEHLRLVGQAVRRRAQAERWLAGFEQEEEQALLRIQRSRAASEVITILVIKPDMLQVYGARNAGYVIYRSLGLKGPPRIEREIQQSGDRFHSIAIDASELAEYDCDRLLVIIFPDEKGATLHAESIFRSVYWNRLEAVKHNNVHMLNVDEWIPYNPVSIRLQFQRAIELLADNNNPS